MPDLLQVLPIKGRGGRVQALFRLLESLVELGFVLVAAEVEIRVRLALTTLEGLFLSGLRCLQGLVHK